ncbi:MAG: hypothetical protein NVS4B1_36160 [Ktedonobacteraceae bacterium]
MGSKHRHFAPLVNVSLEALVPQAHFYRHLERTLDLSFVREFVQETYARGGRPSIDPVVFFKLQLVMFFEDIRSEHLLRRHAADRLSVRWYIGYDLIERCQIIRVSPAFVNVTEQNTQRHDWMAELGAQDRRVLQNIESYSYVILGGRRIGKTSMLQQIMLRLIPYFTDLL